MKKISLLIPILALIVAGCTDLPVELSPINQNQAQQPAQETPLAARPGKNELDLSNQGLTQVSQDVFKMTNLQELDVSFNRLTGALPAEIRHLQQLEILDASDNQMTGVPAEIGQLKNLRVLDLANNQLTGLPYELGNLKNLEILNLSGNNYSTQDLEIIRQGLPADVNIIL